MTIFFSSSPYNLGSTPCLVGSGTGYGENQNFFKKFQSEGAKITEPKGDILRTKTIPRIFVPWGKRHVFLNGARGVEVPLEYLSVLFWIMKREYYVNLQETTEDGLKKITQAINYRINQLLVSGKLLSGDSLVGRSEREIYEIENLHRQLKKFDRGRRSYLNFSSTQDEIALERDKLIRRAHSKRGEKELQPYDEEDFHYESVAGEVREQLEPTLDAPIFSDKPWLR